MDVNIISSILGEQGITGLIVVSFIVLVIWTVKRYEKLQDKLYHIIETLSSELPTIRQSLDDIKEQLNRRE